MANDNRIDYVEFPCSATAPVKGFYAKAFGWKFTDYGPDYTSFEDGRLSGGFTAERRVLLIVLYASDLADCEKRVREAGGKIVNPTLTFPGGRRFHFTDPSGNELAAWSDK